MHLPSKNGMFTVLMLGAGVSAFLLNPHWTNWIRQPFQPRAWVQSAAAWGSRQAEQAVVGADGSTLSAEQVHRLELVNEQLQRTVLSQQEQLAEASRRVAELTGIREEQLPDSHLSVVVAPVVSFDADPARESLQIAIKAWARNNIRRGQWVLAADVPGAETATTVRHQIAGLFVLGRINEVQTNLARVQLASDPRFRTAVQLGRVLADGACLIADEALVIQGRGGGRMVIDQAPRDFFGARERLVMLPAGPLLPMSLSVGEVVESRRRDDSAQHYDLTVEPWVAAERVGYVYVLVVGE